MTPKTLLVRMEDTSNLPRSCRCYSVAKRRCSFFFSFLYSEEGKEFVLVKMEVGRKTCGASSGQNT